MRVRVRVRVSVEARAALVLPAVARTQHGGHAACARPFHLGDLTRRIGENPVAGEDLHLGRGRGRIRGRGTARARAKAIVRAMVRARVWARVWARVSIYTVSTPTFLNSTT